MEELGVSWMMEVDYLEILDLVFWGKIKEWEGVDLELFIGIKMEKSQIFLNNYLLKFDGSFCVNECLMNCFILFLIYLLVTLNLRVV